MRSDFNTLAVQYMYLALCFLHMLINQRCESCYICIISPSVVPLVMLLNGCLEADLVDLKLHEKDSNIKVCGLWNAYCDIILLKFNHGVLCWARTAWLAQWLCYGLYNQMFDPQYGQEIFIFSKTSIPFLKSTQPPS